MVWSLTPMTPAALGLLGAVELIGGLVDIIAPKQAASKLTPAEASVLPLIGGMRLTLAGFILIVVFLHTGPIALELIAAAVIAYECVVQPLALVRSRGRFRSRMWLAMGLGTLMLLAMWHDQLAYGDSPGEALLGSPRLVGANIFVILGALACIFGPAASAKIGMSNDSHSTPYFSMDEHHKLSPVAKRLLT